MMPPGQFLAIESAGKLLSPKTSGFRVIHQHGILGNTNSITVTHLSEDTEEFGRNAAGDTLESRHGEREQRQKKRTKMEVEESIFSIRIRLLIRSQKNKKIMKNRGLGTVSFSSLFRSLNSVGIFILFVQREK